jgi:hypothetical protein
MTNQPGIRLAMFDVVAQAIEWIRSSTFNSERQCFSSGPLQAVVSDPAARSG